MFLGLQDKMERGAAISADDIKLWFELSKLPEKYAYNDEYFDKFVSVDHIIDDLEWPSVDALIEHLETRHNEIAAHNDSVYGERYKDPDYVDRVGEYIAMQLKYADEAGGTAWDRYGLLEPKPSYIVNSNYGKRYQFRKWFTGTRPYTPGVAPEDDVMYLTLPRYAFFRNCYDRDSDIEETFEYWIVGEKLYTIERFNIIAAIRDNLKELDDDRDRSGLSSGMHEDDDWYYDDYDDDYSNSGGSGGNDQYSQAELDNHANQCNPNNDAYWSSRR